MIRKGKQVIRKIVAAFPGALYGPLYYKNLQANKISGLKDFKDNYESYVKVSHESKLELNCASNNAKGRISKRVFQEDKTRQIFRKTNISYPLIRTPTCAPKKCLFFGKFRAICLLEMPVLRFTLLPYYRRLANSKRTIFSKTYCSTRLNSSNIQ